MEMDMDLIRDIMLAVEQYPEPTGWAKVTFDGVDPKVVSYHVMLLGQAGLLEVDDLGTMSEFEYQAVSLTWHGHEFLDSVRENSHWSEAKVALNKIGNT